MIRITRFMPLQNFLRAEWDFHEDHVYVKHKSLTYDFDIDISYSKFASVHSRQVRELDWLWWSFLITGLVATSRWLLPYLFGVHISVLIGLVQKALLLAAYALIIPALHTCEGYQFDDADGQHVLAVWIDRRSKPQMLDAIALIRKNNGTIEESYFDDPIPDVQPAFELRELDVPRLIEISVTQFYDDRLIDMESSLAHEEITVLPYRRLSGKSSSLRFADDGWGVAFFHWLWFMCLLVATALVFFSRQVAGNYTFAWLAGGGMLLLVPMMVLANVKQSYIALYDKNDSVVFMARVTKANRERLEQAVEYVRSRIAALSPS